tara:strand:- start:485 stop:655 length:171 start_codon:yes stop_codon:yes gene_type:complete
MVSAQNKVKKTVVIVKEKIISCSGNLDSLGHPKVYIDVEPGQITHCPYCNQAYHHR